MACVCDCKNQFDWKLGNFDSFIYPMYVSMQLLIAEIYNRKKPDIVISISVPCINIDASNIEIQFLHRLISKHYYDY